MCQNDCSASATLSCCSHQDAGCPGCICCLCVLIVRDQIVLLCVHCNMVCALPTCLHVVLVCAAYAGAQCYPPHCVVHNQRSAAFLAFVSVASVTCLLSHCASLLIAACQLADAFEASSAPRAFPTRGVRRPGAGHITVKPRSTYHHLTYERCF